MFYMYLSILHSIHSSSSDTFNKASPWSKRCLRGRRGADLKAHEMFSTKVKQTTTKFSSKSRRCRNNLTVTLLKREQVDFFFFQKINLNVHRIIIHRSLIPLKSSLGRVSVQGLNVSSKSREEGWGFFQYPADFDGILKDKAFRIRTSQYLEGRSPRNSRVVGQSGKRRQCKWCSYFAEKASGSLSVKSPITQKLSCLLFYAHTHFAYI